MIRNAKPIPARQRQRGISLALGLIMLILMTLLRAVVAADVRLASFERVRPDLEDVFLRLVGRGSAESVA